MFCCLQCFAALRLWWKTHACLETGGWSIRSTPSSVISATQDLDSAIYLWSGAKLTGTGRNPKWSAQMVSRNPVVCFTHLLKYFFLKTVICYYFFLLLCSKSQEQNKTQEQQEFTSERKKQIKLIKVFKSEKNLFT